jgi:hypothetical protein
MAYHFDGGPAGFNAKVPSLALTIDRGFPVYPNWKALFDDLIPLDQKTWDVDNALRGPCYGWHGLQARLMGSGETGSLINHHDRHVSALGLLFRGLDAFT